MEYEKAAIRGGLFLLASDLHPAESQLRFSRIQLRPREALQPESRFVQRSASALIADAPGCSAEDDALQPLRK